MKNSTLSLLGRGISAFLIALLACTPSFAADLSSSVWSGIGEGAHGDNGTLILGINPVTKSLTGYYESSDMTGNITAECKFYFSGEYLSGQFANIQIVSAHPDFMEGKNRVLSGKVELTKNAEKTTITIFADQVPDSCEWTNTGLPGYKPPKNFSFQNGLVHEFQRGGTWKGVAVTRSERTYFHRKPIETSKRKAFLIRGDVVYIYEQAPDWYYVRYNEGKGETTGWIKKIDTVQFSVER